MGCTTKARFIAYHHPLNLRDLLTRVAHGQINKRYKANSRCNQPHGKTCAHIRTGTTIHSTTTDKRFRVKATTNCQTRNVVYMIECGKCSIQYVGETENAFRVCLTRFQSDIRHKHMEKPVAKHFNPLDYSIKVLTIMVIEMIHREDAE